MRDEGFEEQGERVILQFCDDLIRSPNHENTKLNTIARLIVLAIAPLADAIADLTQEPGRCDFLVSHHAGESRARVLRTAAVLPVQTEDFLHAGFLLVDEPLGPEAAVEVGLSTACIGHVESRGGIIIAQ